MSRPILLAAAAFPLLLLYGCTTATDTPAPTSSPGASPAKTASHYTGVVETSAGRYTFAPTSCGVHMEEGEVDIEIGGPGTAPDGEKVFVEFSSTANALVIKLGVDTAFSSPDRRLTAGQFATKKLQVEVSGKTIRVPALELVDNNGKRQSGSLEINC